MRITSRASTPALIMLLSLALVPAAIAGPNKAGHHHVPANPGSDGPEHQRPDTAERPEGGDAQLLPDGELRPGPGPNPAKRKRCRHRNRPGVPGDCDSDDDYYEIEAVPQPGSASRPAPESSGAAKPSPLPHPDGKTESFTPHGNTSLKEEMISARQRWLEKSESLQEARTARARAAYEAYQNGGSVDPALIAEQERAESQVDAIRAEISPLVDEARKSGMSTEVIDLYERSLEIN
jgi:hypothetical protein